MRLNHLLFLIPLAAALVACEGDAQKPAGPAASGSAAAVALSDKDVPVPADFADEADTSINANNYKAELDTLDKEIGSE